MKIGKILKHYRCLHKLTQTDVAEIAGINEKYYGRLERDESVPTLDRVEMLCQAFDIRVIDLLATDPSSIISTTSENPLDTSLENRTVFYCNCCGTTFDSVAQDTVLCPNCQCEFDEDNDYIEVVTL